MWRTIGHPKAVKALERAERMDCLSHAYLLSGRPNVGKMTLALDIARLVNCTNDEKPCGDCNQCSRISNGLHADVRVVGLAAPEDSNGRSRVLIGIDQVREVQREASLKPYEGRSRVFVLDGAERLSEEAANCLLKVLEEPPDQVLLVLLAEGVGDVLPTIVSRCHQLNLRSLAPSLIAEELEKRYPNSQDTIGEVARISGGRLGWALAAMSKPRLLEQRAAKLTSVEDAVRDRLEGRFTYAANLASIYGERRESVDEELSLWLGWWRDVLMVKQGVQEFATNLSRLERLQATAENLSTAQITGAIEAIQEARQHLERNVNPRLVMENLMLMLPRL